MRRCFIAGLILIPFNFGSLAAQNTMPNNQHLSLLQESIVSISAYTAKGDLPNLQIALNNGLDAGLTINEIKEILVQLYAYCGFPRSINAINTLISVSNDRKAKGINDPIGTEPSPISNSADKYEAGKRNLERLTGVAEKEPKKGYAAFVPAIDTFLKEHLFADIFSRGVLTDQQRELTTIAALVALGGVESLLRGHMSIGMNTGISEGQLRQLLAMIETGIGKKEADSGREVLAQLIAGKKQTH